MCVGSRDVLHQGFVRAKIEQPKRAWRPRLGDTVLINPRTWRYFEYPGENASNEWCEPVTDEEYAAL